MKIQSIACIISFCLVALLAGPTVLNAQKKKNPRYTDPAKTDADFEFQGEYSGTLSGGDQEVKFGVQIIALGDGKFKAQGFHGGLPGDGWLKDEIVAIEAGKVKDGKLTLENANGSGTIEKGVMTVFTPDGDEMGKLKKVIRKSKTLGAKPPKGAVVLFDGKNADQWKGGKLVDGNLLMQGTTSKQKFGSHKIHIEFRLPYMPKDKGQARGNSGIYVQGRYEIQMLDSFGLKGKMNECGGIYSVKDCDLNMCYPPLSWQTYDIEFTAAEYKDGKLAKKPRMTVYHNGVKIHDNVELPGDRGTTASRVKPGPEKGPIYLQNHGCPVRYRNIWVVETDK